MPITQSGSNASVTTGTFNDVGRDQTIYNTSGGGITTNNITGGQTNNNFSGGQTNNHVKGNQTNNEVTGGRQYNMTTRDITGTVLFLLLVLHELIYFLSGGYEQRKEHQKNWQLIGTCLSRGGITQGMKVENRSEWIFLWCQLSCQLSWCRWIILSHIYLSVSDILGL